MARKKTMSTVQKFALSVSPEVGHEASSDVKNINAMKIQSFGNHALTVL